MKTKEELQELLEPHDREWLECDGGTTVFAWILKKEGIPFTVMCGRAEFDGEIVQPHYWLELEDSGLIVDFKLGMWLPGIGGVPCGVFSLKDNPKLLYVGEKANDFIICEVVYNMLTRDPNWDEEDDE